MTNKDNDRRSFLERLKREKGVSNDETIEFGGSVNEPVSDSTIVTDDFATLIPKADATAEQAEENPPGEKTVVELEATIVEGEHTVLELDQTVVELEQTVLEDSSPLTGHEHDPEKTVENFNQTVAMESTSDSLQNASQPSRVTRVYAGKPKGKQPVDRTGASPRHSLMESAEIGQTVNPRELSEEDRSQWNTSVGKPRPSTGPSELSPAIDRTFSDKQFEKLRVCKVAEKTDEQQATLDFRLLKKLGQGGMGDVYLAHQASLDRRLALKVMRPLEGRKRAQLSQTGKLEQFEATRRQQFLSEAIVTSDLDHPNIVPIHEAGFSSDGELFYAMKCVVGDPWSDKLKEYSREQNLDVLMKVCDAIACAHNRGVVHRDIKPQNIMLGKFGVVLVMDWGLALPTPKYEKPESILATSGLGGTPAFMAPEMAVGPLEKIGPASDIYLLGATLFLVITGHAPHYGRNITECMLAVRNNTIREVPPEMHGELLEIALKAMADDPEERYATVEEFQQAIRDYRSHAESITLATHAYEELETAKKTQSYAAFSRATFGFEEAIKSWSDNAKARIGLAETTVLHAEAAYEKGDYELGLSLLDPNVAEHVPLIGKLRDALREGENRIKRLALLKKAAAAMLVFILLGGSVAMYVINSAKNVADAQRKKAEQQTLIADAKTKEALASQKEALRQKATADERREEAEVEKRRADKQSELAEKRRVDAEMAQAEAVAQAEEAERQRKAADAAKLTAEDAEKAAQEEKEKAKYEEYVSKIGLAKVRLEDNDVQNARDILNGLRDSPLSDSWEWRWLWHQANQSSSEAKAPAAIIDLSFVPGHDVGAIVLNTGVVQRVVMNETEEVVAAAPLFAMDNWRYQATCVAMHPGGEEIAVGTRSGEIVVFDKAVPPQTLPKSHTREVSDLCYTDDGLLVSGSVDGTVRIWNTSQSSEIIADKAYWHLLPVQQIACSGSSSELTLAVVTADDTVGAIAVWKARSDSAADESNPSSRTPVLEQTGIFRGHAQRVSSVAIASSGDWIASGDESGKVYLWEASSALPTDYAKSLAVALAATETPASTTRSRAGSERTDVFASLEDRRSDPMSRLVSTQMTSAIRQAAHEGLVAALRFSRDGKWIVSGANDNTVKVWNVATRELTQSMKGHGGWVSGVAVFGTGVDRVLSTSNDGTIRVWDPKTYIGSSVSQNIAAIADQPTRTVDAHESDIVSARFSADGTKIVTASGDRTARVMEVDPETLAFRQVARIDDELLDEGTPYVAMSMRIDRVRGRVYIGSADATIRIWDLDKGVEIGRASGTGLNRFFKVSRDATRLLSASSDPKENAILWSLDPAGENQPRIIRSFTGHDEALTAFAISPDGSTLFTADRGGYGIVWDATSGERIGNPIENVRGFRVNACEFTHDGRGLLLATDDETVTWVDLETGKAIRKLNHDAMVTQLRLAGDGRSILTVSEQSTETRLVTKAMLWDLETGAGFVIDEVTESIDPDKPVAGEKRERITSASFDDAMQVVVVGRSASRQGNARVAVWNADKLGERLRDLSIANTPSPPNASPASLAAPDAVYELPGQLGTSEAIAPLDRETVLTMNVNGAFRWHLPTEKLVKSYRSHARLTEACFTHDAKYVFTSSRAVKVWNASTGQALCKLETPQVGPTRTIAVASVAPSPGAYLFATAGDDGVVRTWIWNESKAVIEPGPEYAIEGDTRAIYRICFSPNSDRILAVGTAGLVVVHTLDDSQSPLVLDVQETGDFISAAFSSDGLTIAAGNTDRTARVWSIAEHFPPQVEGDRPTVVPSVVLKGHARPIQDIAFQGTIETQLRVVTASASDARVWDPRIDAKGKPTAEEGREVISMRGHSGNVMAVDTTRDGRMLLTASDDGTVVLWPADPPNIFSAAE